MTFQDEESIKYEITEFTGYNQSVDEQFLNPGETQNAYNVDFESGILKTCKGYSKYISSPLTSAIKTLMAFYKNNTDGTTTSYLLAATDSNLYYWNGTSWVSIQAISNGFFDYLNYQKDDADLIIMTNGVDSVMKWDGSTISNLGGSPPKFKSIALHYERLWGTAINDNPNEVDYSDDLNPEDWSQTENTGGVIMFPTWDGGKCIAVESIFDTIVVFKSKQIFKIYGTYPGEYRNKSVYSSTGAIAPRSIVSAVTNAFFLSSDGIYVYNGSQTQLISNPVKDIIASVNKNYEDKAAAVYFDNKYILAVPTGSSTINNTIIEYDTLKNQFNVKNGITANSFLVYDNKLLFVNETGYVYEYNSGTTFDSIQINAYYETPTTDWDSPDTVKTTTYLYAVMQGTGQIKVDVITDKKTKSITIDLPAEPKVIRKRLRNKGRIFKFRFSNIAGSQFTLKNPKILMDLDKD